MTLLSSWIGRTRGHLLSGHQEQRNTLSAAYTAGSGTLSFSGVMNGIVANTRLSIGTNTFFVISVSGQTATVSAGESGSIDANAAINTVVRVNPMVTDHEILMALGDEMADLSAPDNGLFQMKTVSLVASSAIGYDLTAVTDIIDIYDVRPQDAGTNLWWRQTGQAQYRLDRNADTALFPSGLSLQMFGDSSLGSAIRVVYRAGFLIPTDPTTDLATTGLPLTAYDIPPLGAAMRLMAPREVKRNRTETQSDTRRANEVPPGAVQNSYRGLALLRDQRIQAELGRLMSQYPSRIW